MFRQAPTHHDPLVRAELHAHLSSRGFRARFRPRVRYFLHRPTGRVVRVAEDGCPVVVR